MPKLTTRRSTLTTLVLIAATAVACADGTPTGTARGTHTVNPCDHDVTPPVVSAVSASPNTLWPPNHKWVAIAVSVSASDNCSGVTSAISSVASDEPVNGLGDGNTAPDWSITGALTLLLRAERSGLNDGRTYTIGITSTDAAGNSTSSLTTVFVPHDQGRGKKKGR
jgi:hypothetical protein